ncbi:MAG: DUF1638 domain-containing protein [Deltaproteobacteria bacterium]|jgi:hypothetical protein
MSSPTRVIACGVFRPALAFLELENRYPHVQVTFLPSNLHLRPQQLENALRKEISTANERNEKVVCLYGDCLPDMGRFCQHLGAVKVPGLHCFQMLLGNERYHHLIEEISGTYFLDSDLILNFEEYCAEPLELSDDEIKRSLFGNYQRVLYMRQPSDPDLISRAAEVAEFLHLSLEIRDADYSHLERILSDLV